MVPIHISPNGFFWKGAWAPDGGTRVIFRLVRKPATATASVTTPIFHGSFFHTANRNEPIDVPSTIATNVLISSSPLARDRSLSGSISGTMPYFAGLKMVEWRAIKNKTNSISSMRVEKNAASPSVMTKISNTFTEIKTLRLETTSAKWPE